MQKFLVRILIKIKWQKEYTATLQRVKNNFYFMHFLNALNRSVLPENDS